MNSVKIFDIPFTTFKKKDLIEEILKRVNKNEKTYIVTANAEIAMYAKQNKDYENIIKKANYIVPDGIGVVKGAKILNQYIPERIPGIELMVDLLEKANDNGYSVYFYGAREEVLNMMIKNLQVKFPKLNIIGYNHGYDNDDNNKITNDIINLKPDYIFVAKGYPAQDLWIDKVINKVDKGCFIGVGGSFDVLGGFVKRAPEMWIKLNLEWLYRIAGDPKRWKRSIALPKFIIEVLKEKASIKRKDTK
ncbi:teichoic acid biosynthesis protein A [[Clostridium] sordellii]|uniref:WecB/TagA/CpsF family glycosyltransferase n=1 Tax=Paraclostridium sordellii TaxID=1505 RepID=UPI0005DF499D|nr:WecB/TagA/CpsF family glycosyltransferase [Paeniclostridium sordellii]CEQ24393.1 teichoic acid biosynthesis protein A [[Clostridium] sordellii] [Paeniclostridium sordellii]